MIIIFIKLESYKLKPMPLYFRNLCSGSDIFKHRDEVIPEGPKSLIWYLEAFPKISDN